MSVVAEEWEKFRRQVVRNDPPENVLLSMKIAFYGGVGTFQRILDELSPDEESTEADMKLLRDIRAEVQGFAREMKRRYGSGARDAGSVTPQAET
jgi:hypothetical protein